MNDVRKQRNTTECEKTRDKNQRHKGAFHTKMGTVKDRHGMDLTEAEEINKRGQEYTEELYRKDLNDLDNHDGVITHLEPDILEWEIKLRLRKHHYKQS